MEIERLNEIRLWQSAVNSGDIGKFETYLDRHPNGIHAAKAGSEVVRLREEEERRRIFLAKQVVFDGSTRLYWQQGEPVKMTWQAAINYCAGLSLAGHSDWRLPDRVELAGLWYIKTILDNYRSWYYWSSTTYASYTDYAWYVRFNNRNLSYSFKSNNYYVRCVRGGL
ncbi:MAG: DUF1566 domain-containing protein [Proteobacteria bacterium]|nr:DUF1566 domain-containing protein [Pseudomonadota bacterium]